MLNKRAVISFTVLSLWVLPDAGSAANAVPSSENLIQLRINIEEDPDNLDHYFEFATMAAALGEYKEAEKAYSYMLEVDPTLDRVQLELALLHLRMAQFRKAKQRFEKVLANKPPENVRKNIDKVMVTVLQSLKPHTFNTSLASGFNYDSNANSAASSGQITFQDNSIPLEDSSLSKNDGQVFTAATLSHSYRFGSPVLEQYNVRWNSSTTLYRTEQANLDTLDLLLVGLKTGPVFYLNDNRTQIGINGNLNYIALHEKDYLTITSGELALAHKINESVSLDASATYEHRHFIHSPGAPGLPNRTGNAVQGKTGITYALTNKDILNAGITWRAEKSRQIYYDNMQWQFSGSYTRVLPYDCFANLAYSAKTTQYEGLEPVISTTSVRSDHEKTSSLTIGKRFKNNVTLTIGYQLKSISSSVQNYDYNNQRISTAVGWSF